MKKAIWCILIIGAIAALAYFIGYPFLRQYLETNHPEILEKVGLKSEKIVAVETNLPQFSDENPLEVKDGWTVPEQYEYKRRDIPSLEADFYEMGFPPFLYVTDDKGNLNQKREKSFRDDGTLIYLDMDDSYYLVSASIEYEVPKAKFNSTSTSDYIDLFIKFIQTITNREVSNEDRNGLLRVFTNVFNDSESKNNSITINDLQFTVVLDKFYNLVILKCGS